MGDGPAEFDELLVLRTAATPPELWHELVLHDSGWSGTDPAEAELAFRRLHGGGEPGAGMTALVLLTARRWRRCTSQLLSRLLGTGLLELEELDELAEIALFTDRARIQLPLRVFGVPAEMARKLQPPLRRWAAAHVLRRDPSRFDEVRERIDRLDSRAAAAAMSGVVEAVDVLPPDRADEVLNEGIGWPSKTVRVAALRQLAERRRYAEVARRGQVDCDASVRSAAASLSAAPTLF